MNEFESDWISLSQNFVENGWIHDGRIQDGRIQDSYHHQVESEWMSEIFLCANWPNQIWQNSGWLPSSSWVRMNEFESDWNSLSQNFVQNGWIQDGRIQDGRIQDGRIQDGCHHQVESEWMSEVFCANGGIQSWQLWVSLKGKTKMAESKMA